ncbi:MAG: hypothetical protein ACOCXQ_04680 [Patescibacteria group bacterium]
MRPTAFILLIIFTAIVIVIWGYTGSARQGSPLTLFDNSHDSVVTAFPLGPDEPTNSPDKVFPTLGAAEDWQSYQVEGIVNTVTIQHPPDWYAYSYYPYAQGAFGNVVGSAIVTNRMPTIDPEKAYNEDSGVIRITIQTGEEYVTFDELIDCSQQFMKTCETVSMNGVAYRYGVIEDDSGETAIKLVTEKYDNVYSFEALISSEGDEGIGQTVRKILGTVQL